MDGWLLAAMLLQQTPAPASTVPHRALLPAVTLCLGGYAVSVGTEERIIASPPGGFIIYSDSLRPLGVTLSSQREGDRPVGEDKVVKIPRLGAVRRLSYPEWSTNRPGLAEQLFYTDVAAVDYVLPATSGGAAIWVASEASDGRPGDRATLARFRPRDPVTRCDVVANR